MKDAKANELLEKLSKGDVPSSMVEQLTSGEAGTEASRENTEEKDLNGQIRGRRDHRVMTVRPVKR